MAAIWDKFLSEKDKKIFEAAGFGTPTGFGDRLALLIVDVTYGFTGDHPEQSIEESLKKYPLSCGPHSWESVKQIKRLLEACREANIPIFYTYAEGEEGGINEGMGVKSTFLETPHMLKGGKGTLIVEDIAAKPGEVVISKKKPSAFFGTPMTTYLTMKRIDTVIVTGCTTSGCVRGTVLDAFSYGYKVIVPEECSFDRSETSHAISLFDMQQKYADILKTDDVINEIKKRGKQA